MICSAAPKRKRVQAEVLVSQCRAMTREMSLRCLPAGTKPVYSLRAHTLLA
jgi:hypothetical protein